MTAFIAIYVTALSVSMAFFIWAVYTFYRSHRPTRKRPPIEVGPETEPLVVALYCQYLVAPQKALAEAQQAMLTTAGRKASLASSSIGDFFELLDVLNARSPASSRR